ncbi:MAG: DNA-binding transcriptional LysR family regulator [Bradymonadia bacterium]|jgi:DNA-binding transcriptional LysR family regulator
MAAAAREVGVVATTVGRRIAALEESLGQTLVARTPNGYQPTPKGEEMIRAAEEVERRLFSIEATMKATDVVRGHVRVSTPQLLANRVYSPRVHELLTEHPELTVSLIGENRNADMLRREADIAVRMARPQQVGLAGRRIGRVSINLFGAARFLDGLLGPGSSDLNSLAEKRIPIVVLGPSRTESDELKFLERNGLDPYIALRSNSLLVIEQAILNGAGIGFLPSFLANESTTLRPLLPPNVIPPRDLWLVLHEDVRADAAVRVVTEWLTDVLGEVEQRLE